MTELPKMKRAKRKPGMPRMERIRGGGGNSARMPAMPAMPSTKTRAADSMNAVGQWRLTTNRTRFDHVEWIATEQAIRCGAGIRAERAAVAKEYGLGPLTSIEPEIERGERNYITPMGRPNITKSSRDHRDTVYSGGQAITRLAPMLVAMRNAAKERA